MTSVDPTRGNLTTVLPSVFVGPAGTALPGDVADKVHRTVVDSNLHLPDMFEITFDDNDGNVLTSAGISIGTLVEIWAGGAGDTTSRQLVVGEVTSIEGAFVDSFNRAVVRGYARDHRLQRVRRSRTFLNMKDSDIAREVARQARLEVGEIEETRVAHDHVAQVNQTDWDFLAGRATAIGHEFGVSGGKFYFRKASSVHGAGIDLVFPANLRTFRARVSAGNVGVRTEVRVWDPLATRVVAATAPMTAGSVDLDDSTVDSAIESFTAPPPPAPPTTDPTLGDLGPAPGEQAFVVSDRPLAVGSAIDAAADEVVRGVAEQGGSSCAEAEGETIGDPRVLAGAVLHVSGVPDRFRGSWVVTSARHVIDRTGYRTQFDVTGRQERSLFGLASGGPDRATPLRIPGLVCGIVSNIGDPLHKGRVKVTLPWLSPKFESDWAPVVQFGAGQHTGAMFLPATRDEVLVGFEFGDPHRPYVLGGIVDNRSDYQLGGEPVRTTGSTSAVVWRGFTSPSGNRLAFHDEFPPGDEDGPPQASDLVLGTKNANLALRIDQVAGTVTLSCKPAPPESKSPAGHLTIECGDGGTIDVRAGDGGTVNIDGGTSLNLTAKASVKIESDGVVEISGKLVKIN